MKLHIGESLHIGLFPNECIEDAKEDACAIHKRHDIFTYSEIERFLHGHSDTYINMVIDYIEDLDDGIDIFGRY